MENNIESEIIAVIVAGGKGLRMESKTRKQYMNIGGTPILARSIQLFYSLDCVKAIVVVVPEDDIQFCIDNIIIPYEFNENVYIVQGGLERQESVMNGLKKVKKFSCSKNTIVLIHDAVRPFVQQSLILQCIDKALDHGACVPAIPVVDTLKKVDSSGFISKTVSRKNLYQIQTPQVFDLDLIIKAHEQALKTKFFGTDDASLVENLGKNVAIIRGCKKNIKITTNDDLELAEYFYSSNLLKKHSN